MHTLLRVTGVLSGVESSVELGLGFRGWAAPEPVHEPALVVPGHPRRGAVLQVGEGADRAGAERGTLAHALGLVQPDRGLAEPVVPRRQLRPIPLVSSVPFGYRTPFIRGSVGSSCSWRSGRRGRTIGCSSSTRRARSSHCRWAGPTSPNRTRSSCWRLGGACFGSLIWSSCAC